MKDARARYAGTRAGASSGNLCACLRSEGGHIVDQWLGSNFVEMLAQLGFAPVGEPASPPR